MLVVCVRIEELRKNINKTINLRSSESKTNNSSTTAIVTEFLPTRQDEHDGYLVYTRERHIHNMAPVPLASLGAEMRMELDNASTSASTSGSLAHDNPSYKCKEIISGKGGDPVTPLSVNMTHLQNLRNTKGEVKQLLSLKKVDLKALLQSLNSTFSDKNTQQELRVKLL